ncbi:hypothetical protein [Glaciecola sp. KUL10]|uniref:hypothetical protein n=1 Tax=Glaciecola sp. (strain KUL10) TaxID=2161813 RepID=UPI000D78C1BE|nr:hypothetical protein [Glaciecola sp. KUL10]GBL05760.1 hypothetical protein KUL10_30880 [Glaciecola sp. KUL10]
MDLLDRYILAVKQALPTDKQTEIGRELRANLQDEIDACAETLPPSSSKEAATEKVLQKYGHPQVTAQKFFPAPPLVKSEYMPFFKRVITHGAAALFVYSLLITLVSMLQDNSINPFRLMFQSLFIFLDNAAWMLLIVTSIFYFVGKSVNLVSWQHSSWTVRSLPNSSLLPIETSDTITDLITNSFLLLILWTPLWMEPAILDQQVFSLAPSAEYWRIILTVLCAQSLLQTLYRFTKSYWTKTIALAYLIDILVFAFASLLLAFTKPFLVFNEQATENEFISRLLEYTTTSGQYFFLSLACLLFVIAYFHYRKLKALS